MLDKLKIVLPANILIKDRNNCCGLFIFVKK